MSQVGQDAAQILLASEKPKGKCCLGLVESCVAIDVGRNLRENYRLESYLEPSKSVLIFFRIFLHQFLSRMSG